MNNPDQGARTTVHSRVLMVERWQRGLGVGEIAAQFGVSVRTVRKWIARWRAEGRAGLENRSSRPRGGTSLSRAWVDIIRRLRCAYRLSGDEIAEKPGLTRSTVAGCLTRLGLGRLSALWSPRSCRGAISGPVPATCGTWM